MLRCHDRRDEICATISYILWDNSFFALYKIRTKRMKAFLISIALVFQKKVEPWKLYTMVTGLLSVDLIILLIWQLSDPLKRSLEHFPMEKPLSTVDDIRIRPELEHCESENNSIWLGT